MSKDVLVLNGDYAPISILPLSVIHWKLAVKLIFLGKVQVLHEYEDWQLHSSRLTINVPAVVVTKEYFNAKKAIRFSRRNVYLRDLFTCQYCDEVFPVSQLTFDHVLPKSKGGKTDWENVVTACVDCNSRKGANMLIKPLRKPYQPNYWQLVKSMSYEHIDIKHPSWLEYIQLEDWKEKAVSA